MKFNARKKFNIEALEPRHMLSAAPIITEFMASNGDTLVDGNGSTSDWIEIYNSGDQSVDLAGYSLTDDPGDLNKWDFPSTLISPGEFLVVFASGNNETDLAGNFHTNFSLGASGEYLALVDQAGSILSEFGSTVSDYPAQTTDVSYGLAFDSSNSSVVGPNSSASYWVPTDGLVDSTWMANSFDDIGWTAGTASIGYETSGTDYASLIQTTVPSGTTSVYTRISFTITDPGQILATLQMKYDDGVVAYINGVEVASGNAPSFGLDYESFATTSHDDSLAVVYEDFDLSSFSSLLQLGENTLAIHSLNIDGESSDLLAVPHLEVTNADGLILPLVEGYLLAPTPGLMNTQVSASQVSYSRVGGAFTAPFQLFLTSEDPTETIRYTIDGSVPQENSLLYNGSITVASTIKIRARAYGSQGQLGSSATESYSLASSTVGAFTSDLPIIVIENFGQGIPGSEFEEASFALYETNGITGRSALASPADLTTLIGQHRRGSSTAGNPKPNLRIETRDEFGEDKSVSLLGMPAESDWILYAPYNFDRALIRNTLLYDLSNQMGDYAVRTRFVEVYANVNGSILQESDYLGVYVLMENIKIDSNRVDIDKLSPDQNSEPDVSGGYIIKLDRDDPAVADDSWYTNRNIPTLGLSQLVHVAPDREEITIEQRDYIRGYVQDFEDALYGPNSTDPELGYEAYLEVDATIDHHLIRILSKEPDSLRLSTFLTKERDGKLSFGPLWDSDRSMGADDDARAADPEGWALPDVDFFESDWWGKLFDDPDFSQRWVDRWQELRMGVLSDANLLATINNQADQLAEAQARNFDKWTNVAPNGGEYADAGLSGWEAEISHLSNWLIVRANWMDDQMVNSPTLGPTAGNVPLNTAITLTSNEPGTDIYYTLDGTDPRAEGGGISPNAILYAGPIVANQTTQIKARSFGSITSVPFSNSSYNNNPDESPSQALDGNPLTKYLNRGQHNSGLIVTPNFGSSVVRSFRLTTADDDANRDPTSWVLYGTNASIQSTDNSTGIDENWTEIELGSVTLPNSRLTDGPLVSFSNSTPYSSYKLLFPTLKDSSSSVYGMQVADIRFYSTFNGTGAEILSATDNALAVHYAVGTADAAIGEWSQVVEGLYSVEIPATSASFRITEVNYHPSDPTATELQLVPGAVEEDFEFIELANLSGSTISLNGVQFTQGVTFDFTSGDITSLEPGQTILVVKDLAAFEARYGSDLPVTGEFSGKLKNGGEQIVLVDGASQTIHDILYGDKTPWPEAADGEGPSMVVVDVFGDHTVGANWRASSVGGGTPGEHVVLQGDYDRNGIVGPGDYALWVASYGAMIYPTGGADGNGDGVIDAADYSVWRDRLGNALPLASSVALVASVELPVAELNVQTITDEIEIPIPSGNKEIVSPIASAVTEVAEYDLAFVFYMPLNASADAASFGLQATALTALLSGNTKLELSRSDLLIQPIVGSRDLTAHTALDDAFILLEDSEEGENSEEDWFTDLLFDQ